MEYINEFYGTIPVIKLPIGSSEKFNHAQMFFNLKSKDEKLGITYLKKEQLLFRETGQMPRLIREFFGKYRNLDPSKVEMHPLYNSIIKVVPKVVALLKEYLINNEFNVPLGVHWNPIFKKWDIHPGFGRQVIIDLFDDRDTYKCLAFNTGGHPVSFETEFNSYDELTEYFEGNKVEFSLSANFGSLIPHVHIDAEKEKMQEFFLNSYDETKYFLHQCKLTSNFNFEGWTGYKKLEQDNFKFTSKIILKEFDMRNRVRAVLLALTGKEIKWDELIEIKHEKTMLI